MTIVTMGDIYRNNHAAEFGRTKGSKNGMRKPPTLVGHVNKGIIAGAALGALSGSTIGKERAMRLNQQVGMDLHDAGPNARVNNILGNAAGGAVWGGAIGAGTYGAKKLVKKIKGKGKSVLPSASEPK